MDASCAFLMHFVLHTFQTRTNVTMEINCTTHFGINWTYEQTNSQKDLKETCMHNKATLLCTNLCSFLRSSTFGGFTCNSHISSGWWVLPASLQQALHQCNAPASVATLKIMPLAYELGQVSKTSSLFGLMTLTGQLLTSKHTKLDNQDDMNK